MLIPGQKQAMGPGDACNAILLQPPWPKEKGAQLFPLKRVPLAETTEGPLGAAFVLLHRPASPEEFPRILNSVAGNQDRRADVVTAPA